MKPSKLISKCYEERILQLSNDMSEGIASGTTSEWRAVAMYFRNKYDEQIHKTNEIRSSILTFALETLNNQFDK